MKNLVLIRHAKSSWQRPLADRDRPLLAKGIKRAQMLSKNLDSYIDLFAYDWYSSPAKRAKDTAHIFNSHYHKPIKEPESLYTFSSYELQRLIADWFATSDHLLLFGHNPAFTNIANLWGDYKIDNLPTSGIVHIQGENLADAGSTGKTMLLLTHKSLMNAQ